MALLWSVDWPVGAYLLLRPTTKAATSWRRRRRRLGRGALRSQATVTRASTIGALAGSFNAMAAQIQALIDRLQKELSLWMVSH